MTADTLTKFNDFIYNIFTRFEHQTTTQLRRRSEKEVEEEEVSSAAAVAAYKALPDVSARVTWHTRDVALDHTRDVAYGLT